MSTVSNPSATTEPVSAWRTSIAVIAALTFGSFVWRLWLLQTIAEPWGTDGYYYVIQLDHFVAHGFFHIPDASWVLRFFVVLRWLVGDTIVAVKVGAALLGALCVPAAGYAASGVRARSRLGVVLCCAWIAASPSLTELVSEYPKVVGALPFLLVSWGWALRITAWRGQSWRFLVLMASVLLAMTAHKLGAVIVGIVALVALSVVGWRRVRAMRAGIRADATGALRRAVVATSLVLCVFVLLSWLLPNLLHPSDWQRVRQQLTLDAWWPPPPFSYFAVKTLHPYAQIELFMPWLVVALSIVATFRLGAEPLVVAMTAFVFITLTPVWRGDQIDLGYRLALVAPSVASVLVARLVALAEAHVKVRVRRVDAFVGRATAVVVVLILALVLPGAGTVGATAGSTPDYKLYRSLLARLPADVPTLVIAHAPLCFFVHHALGRDSMAWAPEADLARADIGRIVYGVTIGEWRALRERQGYREPVMLNARYSYVSETLWELLLRDVEEQGNDDLRDRLADSRNPRQVRPWMLQRNNR